MSLENKPTTIVFLRHGQAEQNATNQAGSHIDTSLTPAGNEQARRRGLQLHQDGYIFNAAYSSYLKRARETVEKILEASGQGDLRVITMQGLEERYMGYLAEEGRLYRPDFDGYVIHSINRNAINRMTKNELRNFHLIDGMESDKEVAEREMQALRRIVRKHPGETILVGSHSNTIRTFIAEETNFAKREEIPSGSLQNTGYLVLETCDYGKTFQIKHTEGLCVKKPDPHNDQADNYMGFSMRRTR